MTIEYPPETTGILAIKVPVGRWGACEEVHERVTDYKVLSDGSITFREVSMVYTARGVLEPRVREWVRKYNLFTAARATFTSLAEDPSLVQHFAKVFTHEYLIAEND